MRGTVKTSVDLFVLKAGYNNASCVHLLFHHEGLCWDNVQRTNFDRFVLAHGLMQLLGLRMAETQMHTVDSFTSPHRV